MICKNCGKEYSDARESCPYCGLKNTDKTFDAKTNESKKKNVNKYLDEQSSYIEGKIAEQKKFFIFFDIFPKIFAVLTFLGMFISGFVLAITMKNFDSLVIYSVIGIVGAVVSYFVLQGFFSFFQLNIYYKEKYFIEKEKEDK